MKYFDDLLTQKNLMVDPIILVERMIIYLQCSSLKYIDTTQQDIASFFLKNLSLNDTKGTNPLPLVAYQYRNDGELVPLTDNSYSSLNDTPEEYNLNCQRSLFEAIKTNKNIVSIVDDQIRYWSTGEQYFERFLYHKTELCQFLNEHDIPIQENDPLLDETLQEKENMLYQNTLFEHSNALAGQMKQQDEKSRVFQDKQKQHLEALTQKAKHLNHDSLDYIQIAIKIRQKIMHYRQNNIPYKKATLIGEACELYEQAGFELSHKKAEAIVDVAKWIEEQG